MISRAELEARLAAAGAAGDHEFELAQTALVLAAFDRPGVALGRYEDHLEKLGAEVGEAAAGAAHPGARAAALSDVLSRRHGYAGDERTYDDTQNANLMRVIDRKRGLPVALSILYLHAARAQGWGADGVNFPAHFLIRLEADGARLLLDPFHDGRVMDAGDLRRLLKRVAGEDAELDAAYYESVDDRGILLRLENNIKLRALQAGDLARAAEILERMTRLAPGHATSWRELGALAYELGRLKDARRALERYWQADHAAEPEAARQAVAALQQRLATKLH